MHGINNEQLLLSSSKFFWVWNQAMVNTFNPGEKNLETLLTKCTWWRYNKIIQIHAMHIDILTPKNFNSNFLFQWICRNFVDLFFFHRINMIKTNLQQYKLTFAFDLCFIHLICGLHAFLFDWFLTAEADFKLIVD